MGGAIRFCFDLRITFWLYGRQQQRCRQIIHSDERFAGRHAQIKTAVKEYDCAKTTDSAGHLLKVARFSFHATSGNGLRLSVGAFQELQKG